jgi:hypothetical protein
MRKASRRSIRQGKTRLCVVVSFLVCEGRAYMNEAAWERVIGEASSSSSSRRIVEGMIVVSQLVAGNETKKGFP